MAEPIARREPGLRERKKERTRQRIAECARKLFAARGFEAVPVAEIARAAEVSEQTVFNYFPTTEDLVFFRFGAFEEQLLAAIRERPPGDSALSAFRGFLMAQRGLLGRVEPDAQDQLVAMSRMIDESPALRAREQQIFDRYTASLADLLAAEQGVSPLDVEAQAAASAMIGLHRALVHYTRRRALDGARSPALAREVKAQAERAFARLEAGWGDYAIKR